MQILITGANGQLGTYLAQRLSELGEVTAADRKMLDITDKDQIHSLLRERRPDWIINCAAYNKVDQAELEPEAAMQVNREGVANLAEVAEDKVRILHLSTDYVFDGNKGSPYIETDEAVPISVYGQSKKSGEEILLQREKTAVVRTAWLYGQGSGNFLHTVAVKMIQGLPLRIVGDQIGSPTSVSQLGEQLLALINQEVFGLFHASAEGSCSWYDYAVAVRENLGAVSTIHAITTKELMQENPCVRARRPACSILENHRLKTLGLHSMRHWRQALDEFMSTKKF